MGRVTGIQEVNIADLKPYERNAKQHGPEQVKKLCDSIREFGFISPCLIDSDLNVIAGHGRIMAAREMGMEKVPCLFVDGLTETQRKAYILADNRLTELGEWDMDIVNAELMDLDLADFDVSLTGFDFELPEEQTDIEEDSVPELEDETTVQRGYIYQLGEHRLMCGDSTSQKDIEKLMDGERAELLLTDPPYGISVVEPKAGGKLKVGDDKPITIGNVHRNGRNRIIQEAKEYFHIIGDETTDTARNSYDIVKDYSDNQIIFGGNYFTDFLAPSRCWVVWDKENTGTFADAELAWTSFNKGVKLYKFMWNGLCREGSREVEGKTRVHPTQKPVGMLSKIIDDFSDEGDVILDCFGGSGSTLLACEQTGRKCCMMELEPHYIDIIIKRWENLTGKKAVLLNG